MKKIFCLILVFFEMMGQESLKVKYRNYRQRFNDSFILRGIEDRNCPHLKKWWLFLASRSYSKLSI